MPPLHTKLPWAYNSATLLNLPWAEELELLRKFGWSRLEPTADKVNAGIAAAGSVDAYKQQLASAGVELVGLCGVTICPPAAKFPAEEERANVQAGIELAASIDARGIAVIMLGDPGSDIAGAYDVLATKLAAYADIAKANDIELRLEFLAGPPINGTLNASVDLIRKVDHPNLTLLFDLIHYYASASHMEELTRLPAGKLGMFHIDDAPDAPMEQQKGDYRAFPGEGRMDVPALMKQVIDITGYAGPCTIELYDPRVWSMDPEEVMQRLERSIAHVEERIELP